MLSMRKALKEGLLYGTLHLYLVPIVSCTNFCTRNNLAKMFALAGRTEKVCR